MEVAVGEEKVLIVRKQQRRITAVYFFLAGILTASWSSRIPDVQQRMALNDAAWGSILFFLPVGLVVGLLVSSWLVARFGTSKIKIIGIFISCLLLCLLGLAGSSVQLMATLFLFGAMRTILNISINTQSVEVQRLYSQPIVSTFHGLWSLACFVSAAFGTLLIVNSITPLLHFILVSVICLGVVFFTRHQVDFKLHLKPEKRPFLVVPDRYLFILGLIGFCAMLCESTMFDWSVNYFEKVVQTDKAWVTMGYTAFIIAMAAGRLLGDRLIAKFGSVNLLIANGIIMAVGFALAALFPILLPAAFGFLLIGIGDSVIIPILYTLSARTTKMQPGYAIASVTLIGYTGFITGPLLVGFISEAWGMQWSLGVVGAISLFIPLLTLYVKRFL